MRRPRRSPEWRRFIIGRCHEEDPLPSSIISLNHFIFAFAFNREMCNRDVLKPPEIYTTTC
jgi:hypothetical protein